MDDSNFQNLKEFIVEQAGVYDDDVTSKARLKKIIFLFVLVIIFQSGFSQKVASVFPIKEWASANPALTGWSHKKLQLVRKFFDSLPPASFLVIDKGQVVVMWGDPGLRIKISSMRKSLLSALFGIYQYKGNISLDKSLSDIGIDDEPPLTDSEKTATVRMLLKARSGIYHSYVAGTPSMRVKQPDRGSHTPGTFWYYNNWDFNALGTIFEKQTQLKIVNAFYDQLATPTGMQDFRKKDMYYLYAPADAFDFEKSIHPAYHFRMSARDLARFGYLFLNNGNWNGRQLVPEEWVRESTTAYSQSGEEGGYGYLWWVNGFDLSLKSFSAQGALGKYLIIIPEKQLVIVYLNHTEFPDDTHNLSVDSLKALPTESYEQISRLLRLLLAAKEN